MSVAEKKEFVIEQVFTEIPTTDCEIHYGKKENHFNIPWRICIYKDDFNYICIYLECLKHSESTDWLIETHLELKGKKLDSWSSNTEECCKLNKQQTRTVEFYITPEGAELFLINGKLTLKFLVKIKQMTGVEKKLRSFDESTKEFSDVVLIVGDEKFYVLKTYLASHSTYFKSLFLGNFDESQQSEIELKNINKWDFQNFLEVIHGESAINDDTVDGILHLADMYGSKTAIRKSEEFLVEKSKKNLKEKFGAAAKCKMEKLKKICLSEIKTAADIRSIIPEDASEIDNSVWKELLNMALDLKQLSSVSVFFKAIAAFSIVLFISMLLK